MSTSQQSKDLLFNLEKMILHVLKIYPVLSKDDLIQSLFETEEYFFDEIPLKEINLALKNLEDKRIVEISSLNEIHLINEKVLFSTECENIPSFLSYLNKFKGKIEGNLLIPPQVKITLEIIREKFNQINFGDVSLEGSKSNKIILTWEEEGIKGVLIYDLEFNLFEIEAQVNSQHFLELESYLQKRVKATAIDDAIALVKGSTIMLYSLFKKILNQISGEIIIEISEIKVLAKNLY